MKIEKVLKCEKLIKDINSAWLEEMVPYYEANGINYRNLEILNLVCENDLLTLNSLATLVGRAATNISADLKKLEKRELIGKEVSTTDKRVVYIKATEEGRRLAKEGKAYFSEILEEVLSEESIDSLLLALENYHGEMKNA
ncbi:DNA-binding MarR family transcriptional regulator [Breznakia sp. PF5-3]|uniref:MarR family winged helix-turn-helix transcriptional regulator n=1 Tax=unclassified Breznakia TaxID=2623764 RepID=UPI00240518ED|nr:MULTISPECIES: winged helix DNA-binding protein [unclassified Breznakia]MDF9825760.1 DNA-binding MarR family transcriptional regulator [Breznakia sp. PM6-1]MDF9835434.1 DNA-binding MarR family transcriptional regulator [Breznakia sp. PF5-3]MDF9837666.1 DNA-binding MarR family transcriptional regulator [Breznakia sp. PFB2-8]MDF9859530.1 DNA-binding MarR family transcriptional regulator [Breznakia sp. PH5-24]